MELLLINHPLDCPICDKGGECPLQNQAMTNGRADSRFVDAKRTFPKPIPISTQVLLDRERCVLCQRCTRFSEQIAGDPFIDLLERGADAADRDRRGQAVPELLLRQHHPDLPGRRADQRRLPVPLPPVRPGLHARRVRALRVRLRDAHRHPRAARCCAGWPATTPRSTRSGSATRAGSPSATSARERRITRPLVRDADGVLAERPGPRRCGWPPRGCWPRDERGIGVLAGGRLTVEDAYAYAKFARVAAAHQRRRLPGPAALGRGAGLPGRTRRRHRARSG